VEEAGIWLAVVAAGGTLVSLATLDLMMYYRWRDNKTRLKINYQLGEMDEAFRVVGGYGSLGSVAALRLENKGKQTVMILDVHLTLEDGTVVRSFSPGNPPCPGQLLPGFPVVFYVEMQGLARTLLDDYGCGDTARLQLVLRAGDNSLPRKRLEIAHLEAWASDATPTQGRIEG
jgi:hypothetical protein